ncbi:MAG: CvpA family protein [Spirochaetaceae bacterium]|nr:CvpA family protein [Spirochaetaceae bacterium]
MNLATIDIIFLILMGIAAIRGLFNGLIKELFSIGALILGLLAAMAFYKALAGFFTEQFGNHLWNEGLSFFLVFIVIFAGLKVAEKFISKMLVETTALSFDKGLGFILGLLEGIIICSLLTYFLDFQTFISMDKALSDSFFVPYFIKIFPYLESTGSAVINSIKK